VGWPEIKVNSLSLVNIPIISKLIIEVGSHICG
jgi:hypothetical protein